MGENLNRFLQAHQVYYKTALAEINRGRKESHWMWFIFPQIKGLGHSKMARFYAVKSLAEAKEYLQNSILKANMLEISSALLKVTSNDAEKVLGWPDNLKLQSSMTLFAEADPDCEIFQRVLDKFFKGEKDLETLRLLEEEYTGSSLESTGRERNQ